MTEEKYTSEQIKQAEQKYVDSLVKSKELEKETSGSDAMTTLMFQNNQIISLLKKVLEKLEGRP